MSHLFSYISSINPNCTVPNITLWVSEFPLQVWPFRALTYVCVLKYIGQFTIEVTQVRN